MARTFTYSDLDRTLKIDNSGNYEIKYDGDVIIQSIKTIFSTISGERVRNPIGSTLISLLFEPMNSDTVSAIRSIIEQAVSVYEPRVIIRKITITPHYDKGIYDVVLLLSVKKLTETVRFETKLRSMAEDI